MRNRRLGAMAALALGLAAVLPAVALGGGSAASSHSVVLKEVRYHRGTLTIRRGDSVTWLWRDGGEEHNVTLPGFHSRTMRHRSHTLPVSPRGPFRYPSPIHQAPRVGGKNPLHG